MLQANSGLPLMGGGGEMFNAGFQVGQIKSPVSGIGNMIRDVMARATENQNAQRDQGFKLEQIAATAKGSNPFFPLPEGQQEVVVESYKDPATGKALSGSKIWKYDKGRYESNHPSAMTPLSVEQEMNDLMLRPVVNEMKAEQGIPNVIQQAAGAQPALPTKIPTSQTNIPVSNAAGKKPITPEIARQFIMKAGGDRKQGRAMAIAAGYQI